MTVPGADLHPDRQASTRVGAGPQGNGFRAKGRCVGTCAAPSGIVVSIDVMGRVGYGPTQAAANRDAYLEAEWAMENELDKNGCSRIRTKHCWTWPVD